MKNVSLLSVSLDRFRSFTSPSEIDLSGASGLTLVTGDNRAEPRLGANGAGKSTLFDALCFALYGTSVRGLKVGDLVSHGAKKTCVEVRLEVDGEVRSVKRTGPPSHVFIDGTQVEQVEVDRLVGLSRARFLSSVVFGQAVPLFVDLSIPERGVLLDEVLDLEVWMRASELAGRKFAAATAEANGLEVEYGRAEGAFNALGDVDALLKDVDAWDADRAARLAEARSELEAARGELDAASLERDSLSVNGSDPDDGEAYRMLQSVQNRESKLKADIAVAERERGQIDDEVRFLREERECPTCGQEIDAAFAERHLGECEDRIVAADAGLASLRKGLETVRTAVAKRQDAWRAAREAASSRKARIAALDAKVEAGERRVRAATTQLGRVEAEKNPHADRLERLRVQRRDLRERLRDLNRRKTELASKLSRLDYWRQGFKRVRLFCMGRALHQLELDTMNAARSLGLIGWRITYATETETKSGTSKTGVQIGVESPRAAGQFAVVSPGEGQRVRLCVALGLAGLVQRWSGVRWDVEVFDEPTNWLSEAGIEDLLDLFKSRADGYGKRLFLVDHRMLNASVDNTIMVVKDEEGSRVEL